MQVAGNTPPVSPPQGNPGGTSRPPARGPSYDSSSGGSGGAGGAGSPSPGGGTDGVTQGGDACKFNINNRKFSCTEDSGGGGSCYPGMFQDIMVLEETPGGGGSRKLIGGSCQPLAATAGTANTGGGGGGSFGPGGPTVTGDWRIRYSSNKI